MTPREYINQLDRSKLAQYAERCGIALNYLRLHVKYASKKPSVPLIMALARESDGHVSLNEVLTHFGVVEATAAPKSTRKKATQRSPSSS